MVPWIPTAYPPTITYLTLWRFHNFKKSWKSVGNWIVAVTDLPEPFDRFEPPCDRLLPPVFDIFGVLPIEFRQADDFELGAVQSYLVANGHASPHFRVSPAFQIWTCPLFCFG